MTELEVRNLNLKAGDKVKVQGFVLEDAERFQVDLGSSADHLALHFNPRFHDEDDGAVIVCNSKSAGCWGEEHRESHNPFLRGTKVKVIIKVTTDGFEVELPNGQTVMFPHQQGLDQLSYVHVKGHFTLTSFKIC